MNGRIERSTTTNNVTSPGEDNLNSELYKCAGDSFLERLQFLITFI
jgi:hypothetical protein